MSTKMKANSLEEVKKSYMRCADAIPNWKAINKNELANLYINTDDENMKSSYFSALICKYWGALYKYKIQNGSSNFTEWDHYDWLIHALTYALKHKKWLDPESAMYNDPAGPDKIINRCIASTRLINYQTSNRDLRKANFLTDTLSGVQEEDNSLSSYEYNNENAFGDGSIDLQEDKCKYDVQYLIDKNDILGAMILDEIFYQDSFDKQGLFNKRKVIKDLNNINDNYVNYFVKKYAVNEKLFNKTIVDINSTPNSKLYKYLDNTLQKQKEMLCL